jgi:hypothetical protein
MKTIRQIVNAEPDYAQSSDDQLQESLVGKGLAIGQNRQHQSSKNQVISKLGSIQNECKQAVHEDDQRKRSDTLFKIIFDLAGVMKIFAEMSSRTNNIATMGVLDQESIRKELNAALLKYKNVNR